MPTTAAVTISLHPSTDSEDPVHFDADAANETLRCTGIIDDQDGLLVGTVLEHSGQLEGLFTLTNNHKNPGVSDVEQIVDRLSNIQAPRLSVCHIEFEPFDDFHAAALAPVTEVARFYFPEDTRPKILTGFFAFRDVLKKHKVSGLLGFVTGLTHEDVEYEGTKGKAAVLLMGWTSVEAHEAFRKTKVFEDSVQLLPVKEADGIEQHHTVFRRLSKR